MKIKNHLAALIAVITLTGLTYADNQPPRPLVGVNYFGGWWEGANDKWRIGGKDWRPDYPGRVPLLGDYNSQAVMDREITAAADHGVDFFAILWYPEVDKEKQGPKLNRVVDWFMQSPHASRLKFYLEFCNHAPFVVTTDAEWNTCLDAFVKAMRHPSYLRVGGRLVFKIHSAHQFYLDNNKDENACRAKITQLRERVRKAGLGELVIGTGGTGVVGAGTWLVGLFDFANDYMIPASVPQVATDYPYTVQAKSEREVRQAMTTGVLPYLPFMSAGWNPRPWGDKRASFALPTRTEWTEALRNMATDLVKSPKLGIPLPDGGCQPAFTIYAWNEYGEGGIVAPTKGEGTMKLEAIKEVFGQREAAGAPGARSILDFDVRPENSPAVNAVNLQQAIDWASPRGAALFVPPSAEPYPVAGGLILRRNVSLLGVHGPVGRGTRHPTKPQPVGSVFAIEDEKQPFLTVEAATQVRGIQFWYPRQTLTDPAKIIPYPATIAVSRTTLAQGVTLANLSFFGEYRAMDFAAAPEKPCEQILIEHCYGYPLSGEFIRLDYCYDVPRLLQCHVNPANRRFIDGQYSKAVVDAVIARKTFAFWVDHTDNAQAAGLFTFGTYGGMYLGPATYGQLTGFNFDCVSIGIHKLGDSAFNRNWQIAQGSIIANAGTSVADLHPVVIEGEGHTSLNNVEAFCGGNPALTCQTESEDFLLIRGDRKLTVAMVGCRMRNYRAATPVTVQNPRAVIRAVANFDKDENIWEFSSTPASHERSQ